LGEKGRKLRRKGGKELRWKGWWKLKKGARFDWREEKMGRKSGKREGGSQ
jgi:hypothetical protein